jgi:hypothetical protein
LIIKQWDNMIYLPSSLSLSRLIIDDFLISQFSNDWNKSTHKNIAWQVYHAIATSGITIALSLKLKGKVIYHAKCNNSPKKKTLTINVKIADPKKPNHLSDILLNATLLTISRQQMYHANIINGPIIGTKSNILVRVFFIVIYIGNKRIEN